MAMKVWLALAGVVLALAPAATAVAHDGQHGPNGGHLIGAGAYGTIELVGIARVATSPGLVADVAVSPDGQWAFLANWGEPDCAGPEAGGQTSPDAGAWVIDISDLSAPKSVGFIPSSQDTRPAEGMQVVHVTTALFSGDMLVMNNERCGKNGKGGVSLFDVTDPRKPVKLSEHFGDRGAGSGTNDIHSAFAWDAGDNAYAVIVDNWEWTDVDILDITNPRRPRLVKEIDLTAQFPQVRQSGLELSLLHDMVVKRIGARWVLLLSYWDAGFVQLDVTDPTNPTLIGDTDYANPDPLLLERTGVSLAPEGNGHQAEFTADNRFFIGTDEDFSPYRTKFSITGGPNAGEYQASNLGWTIRIETLPDKRLNGPTVFGGYGCPDDLAQIPPPSVLGTLAPGEEAILVLQRGPIDDPNHSHDMCFSSHKVEAAQIAGYDGVIIVTDHVGSAAGASPDADFCASPAHAFTPTIPAICLGHRAFHLLFGTEPGYQVPYPNSGSTGDTEPQIGAIGARVSGDAVFDGWGYVHLYRNTSDPSGGKFAELDTYAIPEAHDPAYASGAGALTVHEVATHPRLADHAYLSYYSGGLRALQIECTSSQCELVETGGYLDPKGNDFWGVEAFVRDGQTYILGSDRDSGLWIFRDKAASS